MYYREKCKLCGACLVGCPNNTYDKKTAIEEISALREEKHASILEKCITCMTCYELCPNGVNPFDLICQMQEKMNSLKAVAPLIPRLDAIIQQKGEIRRGAPDRPGISICATEGAMCRPLSGSLFDDLTQISGGDFICATVWTHVALHSRIEPHLHKFIDSLSATGCREIIFLHSGCWHSLTKARELGIDLPFRPVHIFEYLLDQLKTRHDEIKPLNMKIAHIRPCTSRSSPEMELLLDELFQLIGVERVRRKYDHRKSLCCGAPMQYRDPNLVLELHARNLDDAQQAGAEGLSFVCSTCLDNFCNGSLKRGLGVFMITDLCQLALGEELTPLGNTALY